MVNKYVPAVILLDKAITFSFTEPLHCTFRHAPDLLGESVKMVPILKPLPLEK
jgi:hypothetical protein